MLATQCSQGRRHGEQQGSFNDINLMVSVFLYFD